MNLLTSGPVVTEDTPAIARARSIIGDLLREGRITINDFRVLEWGISALIEKENRMAESADFMP